MSVVIIPNAAELKRFVWLAFLRWCCHVMLHVDQHGEKLLALLRLLMELMERVRVVEALSNVPQMYCLAVVEVVRRKMFMRHYREVSAPNTVGRSAPAFAFGDFTVTVVFFHMFWLKPLTLYLGLGESEPLLVMMCGSRSSVTRVKARNKPPPLCKLVCSLRIDHE